MSTTGYSQNNHAATILVSEIRQANKIFAEHKSYKLLNQEQEKTILTLSLLVSEFKKSDTIAKTIILKQDNIIKDSNALLDIAKTNHKAELKEAKKGKVIAYGIAVVTTIMSFFALTN